MSEDDETKMPQGSRADLGECCHDACNCALFCALCWLFLDAARSFWYSIVYTSPLVTRHGQGAPQATPCAPVCTPAAVVRFRKHTVKSKFLLVRV